MNTPMTDDYREQSFPIHVEMGDDGPVLDLGKRGASVNLPDSGCVLVEYQKDEDGNLRVKTVRLPAESEDDEPADLNEALNQVQAESEDADTEDDEDDEDDNE